MCDVCTHCSHVHAHRHSSQPTYQGGEYDRRDHQNDEGWAHHDTEDEQYDAKGTEVLCHRVRRHHITPTPMSWNTHGLQDVRIGKRHSNNACFMNVRIISILYMY